MEFNDRTVLFRSGHIDTGLSPGTLTFWPESWISTSDLVPAWSLSLLEYFRDKPVMVLWFWKLQPHVYVFSQNYCSHNTDRHFIIFKAEMCGYVLRSHWADVRGGKRSRSTWTTTPIRRARRRACWTWPCWWPTPLSWRPWWNRGRPSASTSPSSSSSACLSSYRSQWGSCSSS